jgi:hypothetical protein
VTHTQVHLRLLLIIYACGTCIVAWHNIPQVYALFTRTLKFLSKVFSKQLNTGALVFVLAGRCHWIYLIDVGLFWTVILKSHWSHGNHFFFDKHVFI